MKKLFGLFLSLLVLMCFFTSNNCVYAAESLFEDTDYYKYDYSELENKTFKGKKYRTGLIEHRQVINLGEGKIVAHAVEYLTDFQTVSTFSSTKYIESSSITVENKITTSKQVKLGIQDMFKAAIKLESIIEVGANTTWSKEFILVKEKSYSESLTQLVTVERVVNEKDIPEDKKAFRLAKVAEYIEFNVVSSYTEENLLCFNLRGFFYKWSIIDDTIINNYKIRYYIGEYITTVFEDNTYGNNKIGIYKLNTTLKEY